ncbi:MAG: Rossmann-like and DUF2520 domain-containing protein [Psychroflexus maritimus]
MKTVSVFGTGNVAFHMVKAISLLKDYQIEEIYGRNESKVNDFCNQFTFDLNRVSSIEELKPADFYLVCIKDDAIESFIEKIARPEIICMHTSGSLDLLDKNCKNAVFYPLQTFSKESDLNYAEIPFCLEAQDNSIYKAIEGLAQAISDSVFSISSQQRRSLHTAAVFVCNFVNHLYATGEEICEEKEVAFEVLKPLIKETAEKVQRLSPTEAQTGPAKRNDQSTINAHLNLLGSKKHKQLYQQLTNSIIEKYGQKL